MKKILLALIVIVSLFSCKKNNECETWQYYDQCIPKNSNVFGCESDPITSAKFCGHELDGIYAGAALTYHEDENVKEVRHFIKEIQ